MAEVIEKFVYHTDDRVGEIRTGKMFAGRNDMFFEIRKIDDYRFRVKVGEWLGTTCECVIFKGDLADLSVQIIGLLSGSKFFMESCPSGSLDRSDNAFDSTDYGNLTDGDEYNNS